jgi:O-antigen/teichoic acid export membrane protein
LHLLARWIGLNIIISAISLIQRTKLSIELNFKTQSLISLISVTISGFVGIILAYLNYGVWALVIQSLSNNVLNTILLWIVAKWKLSFQFSLTSFRELFKFGSKILVSALIHTIYTNLYSLVIGKSYTATEVGYFNRASTMARFPSLNIVYLINRVVFPLQCQLQDDNERLSSLFTNYLKIACYLIFPLMIALAALAEPLILSILTEKWLPAASLLLILSFAYMWDPVMVINVQILNVRGRSDYYLISEIIKKIIAVLILALTYPYGVKILSLGLVLYSLLDIAIIIYFSKKVINTSYKIQFKNLCPIFLLSIATGIVMHFSAGLVNNNLIKIIVGLISGAIFYIFLSYIIKLETFHLIKSFLNLNKTKNAIIVNHNSNL